MHERICAHARTRTPVFGRYIILVAGSRSDQDEVLRLFSLNRADAMKELVFRLPLRCDDWLDKFVVALEETGNPAALESLACNGLVHHCKTLSYTTCIRRLEKPVMLLNAAITRVSQNY